MALRSPTVLSICTGAGGLDLGIKLARPDARVVCYVEREAFAVANLVAAMEAGVMDEAPIWDDLRTFRGRPWRGKVDWLVGGIPCQPHSVAGQRQGADDERDLWPDAARIIGEVRPSVVFLENVPGIAGYYHQRIGPELRGMGYATQEGLFSAYEVGAPHVRQRLFVLGYAIGERLGIAGRDLGGQLLPTGRRQEDADRLDPSGEDVAHANDGTGSTEQGLEHQGWGLPDAGGGEPETVADGNGELGYLLQWAARPESNRNVHAFPDAHRECTEGVHNHGRQGGSLRLQGVFPPGPDDIESWARMLAEMPEIEPAFCREAHGMAWWLDATAAGTHRLRVLGNGVVPLVAAHAFRTLAARVKR